jgi:hypothetical protein
MNEWSNGDLYDRIDELRAENAELRAVIEHARMENLRIVLELGRVYAAVESDLSDADTRTRIRAILAEVRPLDVLDTPPASVENAELRATIEARDEALMRAGRDNLRLHAAFRRVDELARDLKATTHDTVAPHWVGKLITNALDGEGESRRVETAELANELAGLIQDTTDDFVPLNARYGLADAILAKFDVIPKVER